MDIKKLAVILSLFIVGSVFAVDFPIPQPPQGQMIDTHSIAMGGINVTSYVYRSSKKKSELVDYYKELFDKKEFKLILDQKDSSRDKRLLRYRREDLVMTVAILPKDGETEVVIAKYIQPEGTAPPEERKMSFQEMLGQMPKEDEAGGDLDVVPRPPDSVRIHSYVRGNVAVIIYNSAISVESLRDFYDNQMGLHGWKKNKDIATGEVARSYNTEKGLKKASPMGMSFASDVNVGQLMQGGRKLLFHGRMGSADITLLNAGSEDEPLTIVTINYREDEEIYGE
ncbi:MAG: hypothetical protein GY858_06110 [Candidatus Omnitrophica bacterium]|nr:hypothetical protein [Candidatus Omnitrophota bacterium]